MSSAFKLVGHIVNGLFGGDEAAPPVAAAAPVIAPPTVMPTPDDDAAKAAKRRSIADMQARQGRASTILTDNSAASDKLGG